MKMGVIKFKNLFKNIGFFELIIGFLAVLVLIFVLLQTRTEKEWVKAEVKIGSASWWQAYYASPPFWLGESINIGDSELDSGGEKIAEVLDIKSYELNSEAGDEDSTRKDFYLILNLQVNRDKRANKLKFKSQPLEIGGPIELHLGNTYFSGLVLNLGEARDEEMSELVIEGVWLNCYPWIAEAIPVNGKMKDGMGNVVAEILEKQIHLADIVVTTDDGRVLIRKNPTKRDIFMRVKILVKKRSDDFYFREDQKVKIGENIFLYFSGINVKWLSIKEIFDVEGNKLF